MTRTKKSSSKSSSVKVSEYYETLKRQIDACKQYSNETIKSAFVTKATSDFYNVEISDAADADAFNLLCLSLQCVKTLDTLSLSLCDNEQRNAVKRFLYDTAHKCMTASVRVFREQHVDADAIKKAEAASTKAAAAAVKTQEKTALLIAKRDKAEAAAAAAAVK